MRQIICMIICLLALTGASAKDGLVRCKGEYTFSFPRSISIAEAETRAKKMAMERAIAEKVGTNISVREYQELSKDYDRFMQYSQSLSKGKWVRDNKEAQCTYTDEDNLLWFTVKVDFMASIIDAVPVLFVYRLLRNYDDDRNDAGGVFYGSRYESQADRFLMSFKSPKEGYIAVLFEEPGKVTRLLPNRGENDAQHVQQGVRHTFFNTPGNRFYMTISDGDEINLVHILFSSRNFISGDVPEEMSVEEYRRWLTHVSASVEDLQTETAIITVRSR